MGSCPPDGSVKKCPATTGKLDAAVKLRAARFSNNGKAYTLGGSRRTVM